MIRSVVQGCGSYLPARLVTNADLAKQMDTSDEWIQQRTGIRQRHIAADGELTSHLALKASQRALEHAGLKASDLDLIVLATGTTADRGVLANALHSDGRQHDILYVDGGPSSTRTTGFLRMEGKEVFKHAVVNMAAVVGEVLLKAGFETKDIDWLVPHQANKRIIDGTGRKLGLSPERVVVTVDQHANTSAASIPLALDTAVKDGRIKKNDLLLLEGIGGGLAWGASLVRW